jgi:3'-5' exoribonuclease-like protein
MTMRYHHDFEFEENGETIIPISLGMVSDDNRELYMINKEYMQSYIDLEGYYWKGKYPSELTNWLCVNVCDKISQDDIDAYGVDYDAWGVRIIDFISDGGKYKSWREVELWGYYAAYDHVALAQVFGPMINLPAPIPMFTNELMTIQHGQDLPTRPEDLPEHHALNDAKYQRLVFETWSKDD